jgi:DNA-binding NarL/FixJ family response regulator
MTERLSAGRIFIVGARELTSASLVEFLKPWAADQDFLVETKSHADELEILGDGLKCRLLLLSVAAGSVSEKETQKQLKLLRAIGGNTPIVVVSDRDEASEVIAALGSGVQGFLPTATRPELALHALSFIVMGGSYFPSTTIQHLEQPTQAPENPPSANRYNGIDVTTGSVGGSKLTSPAGPDVNGADMTNRQREVLDLLCQGEPNKIIARKLGTTEATVKVHVRQIMRKLGATNRTQAALCAVDYERLAETGYRQGCPGADEIHEYRIFAAE